MAGVLAAGAGAVLSHRSAAALWELTAAGSRAIDVIAPRKLCQRSGLILHYCLLADDEITVRDGIPVTTVARTLLDLAGVLPRRRLERAVNEAEFRRYGDGTSLPSLIERHRGARGIGALRACLQQGDLGSTVTRSELEDRFLSLIEKSGLPRPEVNAPLAVGQTWIEADFVWRASRLSVELDGRAAHATRRAFERDRDRDRRLQVAGWRVVRVTWRQLEDSPASLTRDLRELLRGDPPLP